MIDPLGYILLVLVGFLFGLHFGLIYRRKFNTDEKTRRNMQIIKRNLGRLEQIRESASQTQK